MKQIRISKQHCPARKWLEPLPLELRDPDVVRAKQLARRAEARAAALELAAALVEQELNSGRPHDAVARAPEPARSGRRPGRRTLGTTRAWTTSKAVGVALGERLRFPFVQW